MPEQGGASKPGALRRALFQDVPYILDSLWRWGEFRINRLGTVEFDEPHRYQMRPAWQSGAFALYVLMCSFAIFGPTWDSLCALHGFGFMTGIRHVASALLVVVAALIFLRLLNAVTFQLARRAEILAALRPDTDPGNASPFANAAQRAARGRRLRNVRVALDRRAEEHFGNLSRFFRVLPRLRRNDAGSLVFGLFVLMFGSLLVIAPVAATAYGLRYGETDAMGCTRLEHPGLVVAQFAALLLLLAGGWGLWRGFGRAHALRTCVALLVLLAAVIGALWLWFTPAKPSEAAGGFYPHVYLPLLAALFAVALAGRLLAHIMFSGFGASHEFRAAMAHQDLLRNERTPPDVSNLRLVSAFINGVTANPLHFALLPAFVAFMAPTDWLEWLVPMFALVSAILLMYGSLSSRWEQMLMYVRRWFLVGTPLVMSLAVILLAVLRLLGVQYVSTVLDATPVGVLFIFIVMMYVAFWFFEYWINRWLGEQLLEVLGADRHACPGFVKYDFQPGDTQPWASPEGRVIALHGTGRFVAQGWFERRQPTGDERPREHAFTTYGMVELFDALGERVANGSGLAHDIRRRVHLYFTLINMLLIAGAIGLFLWHLNWSRPLAVAPMVRASAIKPEQVSKAELAAQARATGDTLAQRLLAQAAERRPSLVVAASGGGTRAAVYTAVALEGMAQINRARDVVLLSGVSGGGVAAAVFASRFAALRDANPRDEDGGHPGPWMQYVATVSQPYIQDVLEGAGELRISGSASLGVLLQESLERRAFAPQFTAVDTFAKLKDPALILNSAISGHPYSDSELLQGRVAAPGQSCVSQSRPYANLAGGRLIFTNLDNLSGFPSPSTEMPDMWLPYRIVNDGSVELAAASALTANFPPVFSNARVRLITRENGECPAQSYFVTDGGATENLGLVSALFALRGTLAQLPDTAVLGDIHVLALEASAIDYDYRDDRGVGAATGGSKERINAGLTQVLIREVGALVAKHGAALRVHYLPLPVAFRSRGGFGTHWMFARNVRVTNPLLAVAPSWKEALMSHEKIKDHVDLSREEVMVTWRALFDPRQPICRTAEDYIHDPAKAPAGWTADVQNVTRWICGHDDSRNQRQLLPDYQVEAWQNVVRELGRIQPGPAD
ncbi:MAG TPA: hypothetical protein VFP37_17345 [Steroidobacteraceae bacterium]|nr:hypothetical protein [Steroidobacteraceae bacterium]